MAPLPAGAKLGSAKGRRETGGKGTEMPNNVRLAAAGLLVSGLVVLVAAPATASDHHTWIVEPGTGTISAAVASASPGDTLQLEAGTFYDSVFVAQLDAQGNPEPKSVTIKGQGDETVIKPPAVTTNNPCNSPGSVEGICVSGQLDNQGNPVVTNPVHDVTISDLRTTGFSDSGVIGFNTVGLEVKNVRSDHNGGYGIARFVSTHSLFQDNWTSFNGEAGLYMGDSPHGDSVATGNQSDHNGYGIFMRDSTELTATDNTVWGNCIGILAINTGHGAPGDLPAGDYRIAENDVHANDAACPANPGGGPATSGIGIALVAVHDTQVVDNSVNDNKPTGPSIGSGGVVVLSNMAGAPTNNLVTHNSAERNQPADIVSDGTGSGNKFGGNHCDISLPASLDACSS